MARPPDRSLEVADVFRAHGAAWRKANAGHVSLIRRFLLHVLPNGFHRIRHYGLFAKSSCADNIARARELLTVANPQSEPASVAADSSKPACPCCGGRMIVIEVFERGTTPRHRPTAPPIFIRLDTS